MLQIASSELISGCQGSPVHAVGLSLDLEFWLQAEQELTGKQTRFGWARLVDHRSVRM
jgi:hypothetical protein